MPNINTHLHAALKLSKKMEVKNLDTFYLGNVYPDCWDYSEEEQCLYHYKKDISRLCDIEKFMETKERNAFNLGYLFHLWLDNYILNVDMKDISKYDCMICDMEVILPLILELQKKTFEGKEAQAMEKILALESEPMPLYLVPEHKKEKYIEILDEAVETFVDEIRRKNYVFHYGN